MKEGDDMARTSGWRVGVALVLIAVAAWLLLWWLGYWVIAFAVAIAVVVVGGAAYVAARAGIHDAKT